jgi:hypothetical protein
LVGGGSQNSETKAIAFQNVYLSMAKQKLALQDSSKSII